MLDILTCSKTISTWGRTQLNWGRTQLPSCSTECINFLKPAYSKNNPDFFENNQATACTEYLANTPPMEGCPTCQNSDGHRWVDPVDEGCAIYLHLFFRMTAVVRSWLRCIVFVQKFREDNLEWETSSTRISISSENLDELKPLIEAEGQQVWNQGSNMSSCQWAAKAIISS